MSIGAGTAGTRWARRRAGITVLTLALGVAAAGAWHPAAASASGKARAARPAGTHARTQTPRTPRSAPVPRARGQADGPSGFFEGTDSWPMPVTGSGPYNEPEIGGPYGGYIGMTGNWATWLHCHDKVAWAPTNSRQANNNFTWHHDGIGTGVYWFMAGPGLDPKYNGTTGEAFSFGQQQAARTLLDISHVSVKYPIVFADVEIPGNAPGISPAPDNGWNTVYTTPCSGTVQSSGINPAVDRADLNGFYAYLTSHSSFKPGVYSSPAVWASIFGTGSAAALNGVAEWTYTSDTSSLSNPPFGFCLRGTATCAHFFGGVSRGGPDAVMWQWSGGGGTFNGFGDFDQIDTNTVK